MVTAADRLEYLRVEKLGDCTRCPLHKFRTNIVFGEGNPEADIMFVGEAPGQQEDLSGRPFVGRSGQLLDQWLASFDMKRSDVYIANTCKCRPPENRDPYPPEKEACAPYLHGQIFLIRPKVLIALGRHAANSLTQGQRTMGELRASDLVYENDVSGFKIPVIAVYHPSFVLRKGRGDTEKEALADLQKALEIVKNAQ